MKLDHDSRVEARQFKAVQKTGNYKRLFRIWKKSSYVEVRLAAIYKLTNQPELKYIAQKERISELRCEAVKKLKDKALLITIAKEDESEYVRLIAQKKLEYLEREPLSALNEIDAEAIQMLGRIYEHNEHLRSLATGKAESEDLW